MKRYNVISGTALTGAGAEIYEDEEGRFVLHRDVAALEAELERIGRLPEVAAYAGVGDGSAHDAIVAMTGHISSLEEELADVKSELAALKADRDAQVAQIAKSRASLTMDEVIVMYRDAKRRMREAEAELAKVRGGTA